MEKKYNRLYMIMLIFCIVLFVHDLTALITCLLRIPCDAANIIALILIGCYFTTLIRMLTYLAKYESEKHIKYLLTFILIISAIAIYMTNTDITERFSNTISPMMAGFFILLPSLVYDIINIYIEDKLVKFYDKAINYLIED